ITSAAPAQPTPQAGPAPQLTLPPAASVLPRRPHYVPRGLASYYTAPQPTANGEVFDTTAMTAAHRSLPFGTRLRVTRLDNGQSVTVRINDRGPYVDGRVVDLSYAAAARLGMVETGLADVRLSVVHWPKPRPHKPPAQQAAPANARPLPRPAPTRLTLLRLLSGTVQISR
ncbi:MAG: septal ring lytic transglycosylase RlpA family protein, partial [Bradyrhizobium sp.]